MYHFAEAIHLYPEIRDQGCRYLHVHFMVGTGTIAVFLNWIYGLPYSMTAHGGDIFEDRLLQSEKLTFARFTRLGTHFNARFLSSLVPESRHVSLRVIPFGIDRDKIPGKAMFSEDSQREAGERRHGWRLLTVGRLVWEKAQHLMLEACAQLAMRGIPFHLRIVGEGPLRPSLENQIQSLGLQDNVTLLGALPPQAVWREYLHADLFVLSSISEGSPFVIMEAMACGVPAVAPAMRGIPEMIRDGVDGRLFPTGSARGMPEAIAGILIRPDLRAEMARAAEANALEHFNQIDSITEFHQVLRAHADMA